LLVLRNCRRDMLLQNLFLIVLVGCNRSDFNSWSWSLCLEVFAWCTHLQIFIFNLCWVWLFFLDLQNNDAIDTNLGLGQYFGQFFDVHAFDEVWLAVGIEVVLSVGQSSIVLLLATFILTCHVLSLLLLEFLYLFFHSFCHLLLLAFQFFPLFLFLLKELSQFCLVFERRRLSWEICQFFRHCLFFNDFNCWFMVWTSWFLWTKILFLSIAHFRSVFLMVSCIDWQFLFQVKGLLSFDHLHPQVYFRRIL